jgi:hypothetical protein
MGGRGSGGRRIGSGKKPKSELEHAISGTTGPRGVVLQHPSGTAIAPIATFEPPAEVKGKVLKVWRELAPEAFAARTLTPATSAAFEMLCHAAVLERALRVSKRTAGGPNHRGLQQRVATWKKDFMLAPLGKPMVAAAPAIANPLDRFTKKVGA